MTERGVWVMGGRVAFSLRLSAGLLYQVGFEYGFVEFDA